MESCIGRNRIVALLVLLTVALGFPSGCGTDGAGEGNTNTNGNGDTNGNINDNVNGDDGNGNANENGGPGAVTIETYTDRDAFEARLGGVVRVLDFDDIDASASDVVSFEPDRYEPTLGIVVTGTDGQYVGETFGFPEDYIPASPPNMYAPGPMADDPTGGHHTVVTFSASGQRAAVAGFGAVFIDTDFPGFGPSGISVFGENGAQLAEEAGFLGSEGEGLFRGMVAVDDGGNPAAAIFSVELVNGNSWAATTSTCCEGVTLDDFVFAEPEVP